MWTNKWKVISDRSEAMRSIQWGILIGSYIVVGLNLDWVVNKEVNFAFRAEDKSVLPMWGYGISVQGEWREGAETPRQRQSWLSREHNGQCGWDVAGQGERQEKWLQSSWRQVRRGPVAHGDHLDFIPSAVGIYSEEWDVVAILINHTFCNNTAFPPQHVCLYISILIKS